MTLAIRDGWPYRQPDLRVKGMRRPEHADAEGNICLWQTGDPSRQWMTLDGWRARVAEWRNRQTDGFDEADAVMDAHAYFKDQADGLAIVDFDSLIGEVSDGGHGRVAGRWPNGRVLALTADHGKQDIKGRWFYRDELTAPPTSLDALRASLTSEQRTHFDNRLGALSAGGGKTVFVLVWGAGEQRNAVVILVTRSRGKGHAIRPPIARAMEVAFTDIETLRRRAGADALVLANYSAAIFGVGAVGSQVAVSLAESGLGELTLFDGDRVRPGNVIRHRAAAGQVGMHKVEAIKDIINARAPWTTVTAHPTSVWNPNELARLSAEFDIVIDCTGNAGFGEQLAYVLAREDTPLLSAALYRNGAVSRVSRQADGDVPLAQRTAAGGYSEIPESEEPEPLAPEAGCSALVNLAPPPAVTECAALAAQVAVDVLRGTRAMPAEIVTIHRPLDQTPYDNVGRLLMASRQRPRLWLGEAAWKTIKDSAAAAHPVETGGVLLGVLSTDGRPWITEAVEVPSASATHTSYVLPADARPRVVDAARARDRRLGYLGDWHSHPADIGPSLRDSRTMRHLAQTTRDCPNPVLIIARRAGPDGYTVDAREASIRRLRRLDTLAAGGLPKPTTESRDKDLPDDSERPRPSHGPATPATGRTRHERRARPPRREG